MTLKMVSAASLALTLAYART